MFAFAGASETCRSRLCARGAVCADDITRSAKNHWQLVMRLNDQQGHREKVVMDCRAGVLSPRAGQVDRGGYATALGRRACRLAGEGPVWLSMDITLVYPHQLFADHPAITAGPPCGLIEDPLFFGTDPRWPLRVHRQRLLLHRAAMKAYAG